MFFPSDFKGTVRVFSLWTSKEQFGFFPLWTLQERFLFFPVFGLKVFFYVFQFKKLSPVPPEVSFPALQAWPSPLQALPGWCCSFSWLSTGFVCKP